MRSETSNYSCKPTECIPYTALPPNYIERDEMPEAALQRIFEMLRERGLYAGGQWQRDLLQEGSDQERTAAFFNWIVYSAGGSRPAGHRWRSQGKKMVEGKRKPDVVLVSKDEPELPNVPFSSILSYCELKKTEDLGNQKNVTQQQIKADKQLVDLAGYIMSTQTGRRFFVGLILCNSDKLTVALFVRGCTIFTTSFDINTEPLPFINIILTLTAASPTWTGSDRRFNYNQVNVSEMTFTIIRTISTPLSIGGRGTAVHLCKSQLGYPFGDIRPCVLKDCWPNVDWPTNIDAHKIMEEAKIIPIEDPEENEFFGERDVHGVFQNCVPVLRDVDWDYTSHKLPGIPIIVAFEEPKCDLPYGKETKENGRYKESILPDTTENTRAPPDAVCKARKHVTTVSLTVGVPITFFSCRRELINGLMGAIAGHFNGIRLNVLHCDVSQSNLMLRVAKLEEEDAFPDWPSSSYVKRAGILADWGLALPYPSSPSVKRREGFATGTFPFIATELLSTKGLAGVIPHMPHHDLESFFWVLWIISINYDGPYGKRRKWVAHNGMHVSGSFVTSDSAPSPNAGPVTPGTFIRTTNLPPENYVSRSSRFPVDNGMVRRDAAVPIWATSEPHKNTLTDVYVWRNAVNEGTILLPVSSYFQTGPGGKEFKEGMLELLGYFRWRFDIETNTYRPPTQVITHKAFLRILAKMRDAIDDTDRPSPEDLQRGRQSFRQKPASQASDSETLPNPPSPTLDKQEQSSNNNKRTREELVEESEGVAGPSKESDIKRSRKRTQSPE